MQFRRSLLTAAAALTAILFIPAAACSGGAAGTALETPNPADGAVSAETTVPSETPQDPAASDEPLQTPENVGTAVPAASETPASGDGADAEEQDASNGTGAYTITADVGEEGKTYVSNAADENALRVENGCAANVESGTIEKLAGAASAAGDSARYGLNAAVLTHGGAALTLLNSNVQSDTAGANGIFVYGAQSSVSAESTAIRTQQDDSCGLVAAGGGSAEAESLSVLTQGASSAAICARDGGTVVVDAGTYTTNGEGSAAVVSDANVSASNATLRAAASGAVELYGGGNVMFTGCSVSGSSSASLGGAGKDDPCVLFYRGEDETADSADAFTMTNGSLKSGGAELFSVSGAACELALTNVSLTLGNGVLLRVEKDAQGGQDGTCKFVCSGQVLSGRIFVDEGSSLDLQLTGGSSYTGSINPSGTAGTVAVTLEDGCTWSLTSDAYVTSFTGKTKDVETNGYTLYVNGSAVTK